MVNLGKCNNASTNPRIVIKDRRSRNDCNLLIINPERKVINIITIDGCYITNGIRCDFLAIYYPNEDFEKTIFIELKGSDIKHAISQIIATLESIYPDHVYPQNESFIIFKSRNPLLTGEVQNYKINFKRKYNSILKICRQQYEYYA